MALAGARSACILDVDSETGRVTIVRYAVGHDCGNVIDPLIVEGQILGGVTHGLSNALERGLFMNGRTGPTVWARSTITRE